MSAVIELFANPPTTPVTVSSGGTTTPTAGTVETWTLAGGYAQLPPVSNAGSPPSQFHFYDVALPSEIMLGTNLSGTTLTVTRGAEGAVVAHTAGFTIAQTVSAGVMGLLAQQSPSAIPANQGDATNYVVTTVSTTNWYQLSKSWPIPANNAIAGTIYRLSSGGSGVWASVACSLNFMLSAFGLNWAEIRVGSAMLPLSSNFCWWHVSDIFVGTPGASGAVEVITKAGISVYGANLSACGGSSGNSTAGLAGQNASTPANLSVAGTIELTAAWATAAGTLTSFGSVLERIGQ